MCVEISKNNNFTFTSRCVQIRDAQWVCHKVNTEFPNISTTRFLPALRNIYNENPYRKLLQLKPCNNEDDISILYDRICEMKDKIYDLGYFSLFKLLFKSMFLNKNEQKNAKKISWVDNFISIIKSKRIKYYKNLIDSENIYNIIQFVKTEKTGNCYESAKLTELILKLNKVNNASTVTIKNGEKNIDHAVCLFNADGSEFYGEIKPSTIIIDSWAEKADFASNMINYYKNLHQKTLGINPQKSISFTKLNNSYLTNTEIHRLREIYPQLLYRERTFMPTYDRSHP